MVLLSAYIELSSGEFICVLCAVYDTRANNTYSVMLVLMNRLSRHNRRNDYF